MYICAEDGGGGGVIPESDSTAFLPSAMMMVSWWSGVYVYIYGGMLCVCVRKSVSNKREKALEGRETANDTE